MNTVVAVLQHNSLSWLEMRRFFKLVKKTHMELFQQPEEKCCQHQSVQDGRRKTTSPGDTKPLVHVTLVTVSSMVEWKHK